MLKAPLKKNLLICAIIFACCGSQNSDIEIDLSNTSTPKSIPTSSTTVLVNKEYAKDLEVGDCFEFSNRELDYVAYEEQILLIDCNELHTNEVITIINFLSDEETVFNDDNIPTKELSINFASGVRLMKQLPLFNSPKVVSLLVLLNSSRYV